ncbi:hypothetical protein FB548_2975 [Pseudoxanthomonas sp. 3HH-4]|uniref:hypothetical protein n=1 Tax=Pseudoxanthomonas sp. 3HH-4 TaxID=1690214 RepID=UPI001152B8C8|nr:hypothetical protein [Pseudoxanthomonas sp. 3HH-4]TQM06603.1 hypothetical protein FB548_2975 [Pseudoxanthomonas sp. 3HH-4]
MKKLMTASMMLCLAACAPSAPEADNKAIPAAPAQAAVVKTATPTPEVADDPAAVNQAIDEVLGDHARYEAVIRQLQQAVAANDAVAVAALVDYPFSTVREGQPLEVADADAFVRDYDRIMLPAIAEAITRQKYSQLMVNYKGVMFGNGEAWVNGICKDDACKDVDVRVVALQPTS